MSANGPLMYELSAPVWRLTCWCYVVAHENATIRLTGADGAEVVLKLAEDGVVATCKLGDVQTMVLCQAVFPTCQWTRLKFAIRLRHNSLLLRLGTVRCKRLMHFPLPCHVSFTTVALAASRNVFVSFGSRPFFPPDTLPTPVRTERPLKSVSELLDLSFVSVATKKAAVPRGLLVCHDFKGNYLRSDACLDTVYDVKAEEQYVFTQWPQTSLFVYFSHERVSFPPASFVSAARTNRCPILGTLITEWDPEENVLLFSQPVTFAEALAAIAADRGFDGWLINIEAEVPAELLVGVRVFLKTLRKHCVAIMYDSVTTDTGEVKWQNTVTDRNRGWLECCDGIFTNYAWKPEMLPTNAPEVYVGTDCFGRGTYLGGGNMTGEALLEAKNRGLSNAIFAPGWTVERATSNHAEEEMWRGIVWKGVAVEMTPFEGSFEQRSDGLMACSHGWCRRRTVVEIPWTPGGITRVYVREKHAEAGPYYVAMTCEGMQQEFCGFATKAECVAWTFCVTASPEGRGTIRLQVEDGGRDEKGWAGHYGTLFGTVEVEYTSTQWTLNNGIANVYPGKIVDCPEWSHFSVGAGNGFYVDGQLWRESRWSNLALQSRLPNLISHTDYFMEIASENAFCFGSCLHLIAVSKDVRVPLYDVRESHSLLRVVVAGSLGAWVGSAELIEEARSDRGSGWTEVKFSVPANARGALSFSLDEGEAFIGFLSFSDAGEVACSPCSVTKSFNRRGWWRHLVTWNGLPVEASHSLLRVYRGGNLVSQLLPSAAGSFCDECEEENPRFTLKLLN